MKNDFTVAVDFDGTVVTHEYPEIGREVPHCLYVLRRMQSAGIKIVLNTMRSDREERNCLAEAVNWFKDNEIALFGVNENPTQKDWTDSPKVYAHRYIDDAAVGVPLMWDEQSGRHFVDWIAIEKLIFHD